MSERSPLATGACLVTSARAGLSRSREKRGRLQDGREENWREGRPNKLHRNISCSLQQFICLFIYCQLFNFNQMPASVSRQSLAIPNTVIRVAWLLVSYGSFVIILMTQLLLHFNMEQTLVSENISFRCSQQRDLSAKIKYTNKKLCPEHLLYNHCHIHIVNHFREERRWLCVTGFQLKIVQKFEQFVWTNDLILMCVWTSTTNIIFAVFDFQCSFYAFYEAVTKSVLYLEI